MGAGARARAPRMGPERELVADDGDGGLYDEDWGDGAEGALGPHIGEILEVVGGRTAGTYDVITEPTELWNLVPRQVKSERLLRCECVCMCLNRVC